MAKFHLFYNPNTAALHINETGATIQTADMEGFTVVFSDDDLQNVVFRAGQISGANCQSGQPIEIGKVVQIPKYSAIVNFHKW